MLFHLHVQKNKSADNVKKEEIDDFDKTVRELKWESKGMVSAVHFKNVRTVYIFTQGLSSAKI